MSVSSSAPSASTIPKWPSNCTNTTNVFAYCENMRNAWTDDWKELMPETITEHSGTVTGTGNPLNDLFDITWGGKGNKYFYVYFYYDDGTLIESTDECTNPQRVEKGGDAIVPDTSAKDIDYPEEFWILSWSEPIVNIQSETHAKRTYTRITYDCTFYSLYEKERKPEDTSILPTIINSYSGNNAINKGDSVACPVVSMPNSHVKAIGWTLSDGITESTSGELLDESYFSNVTSDINAYFHTYTDTRMEVTFKYYYNNAYTETTKMVNYNSFVTPPEIDERTGYSFGGWEERKNVQFDFNSTPITSDCQIAAVYSKNIYTISFIDGYSLREIDYIQVPYDSSIDKSEFPSSYGTSKPNVKFYGWEDSPEKYTHVSKSATISSLYVEAVMIDTDIYMTTGNNRYTVHGMISTGTVTSVSVNIDDESSVYYSAVDFKYDDNKFSFDIVKDNITPKEDIRSFSVDIEDARNLKYMCSFNLSANFGNITAYINKQNDIYSWCRNSLRGGEELDANLHESVYIPNPDTDKYLGIVESCGNWHVDDGWSKMRVVFNGYDDFSIYVMNCGENNYDFPYVSKINTAFSTKPTTSDVEVYDYVPNQTLLDEGPITIDNFKKITYTGLDRNNEYFIDVAYVKDSHLNSGSDRAYVLFDVHENIYTVDPNIIVVKFDDSPIKD